MSCHIPDQKYSVLHLTQALHTNGQQKEINFTQQNQSTQNFETISHSNQYLSNLSSMSTQAGNVTPS
jgi:hypothetical protein